VTDEPPSASPAGPADQAYWTRVYAEHRKPMLAAAVRLLGIEDNHLGRTAESVVQDVMVGLIKRNTVLHATNLEAYLVAAVKNRAIDVLRQENRRERDRPGTEADPDESWEDPSEEDVAEAVTDAVIRERTREVLAQMDEQHRTAFRERIWEARPFTQIGPEMGVSDSYAGRLYREALAQIREALGVDPGTAD
jgi:RNA polymerase sigma factor (sigma-70 family)